MSMQAEFICCVYAILKAVLYDLIFCPYDTFFFFFFLSYNSIFSRYYQALSMRLGDHVYKHYVL